MLYMYILIKAVLAIAKPVVPQKIKRTKKTKWKYLK